VDGLVATGKSGGSGGPAAGGGAHGVPRSRPRMLELLRRPGKSTTSCNRSSLSSSSSHARVVEQFDHAGSAGLDIGGEQA
jgi:hypothetical protein